MGQLIRGAPDAHRQSGQQGGTQGGGLGLMGADHRHTEQVGLDLKKQVVAGRAAIHPEFGKRAGAVAVHRMDQIHGLKGNGVERRAGDMGLAHATGQTDQGAAGVAVPVGGSQAGEGGDEQGAVAVRHGSGQGFDVSCLPDQAEAVTQPLHHRPTDENAAFKHVVRARADPPAQGGEQAVL